MSKQNNNIFTAIQDKNYGLVKTLITAGASVNTANEHGTTPLQCAVLHQDPEIAELLIKHMANVNYLLNEGDKSILQYAINQNSNVLPSKAEIVRLLVTNKADLNHKASDGSTALSLAQQAQQAQNALLLTPVPHNNIVQIITDAMQQTALLGDDE